MAKKFIHTYGDHLEGYSQYSVTVVAIGRLRIPLGVILSALSILVVLSLIISGLLVAILGDLRYWFILLGTGSVLVALLLGIGTYAYIAWAVNGVRKANK